SPSPWTTANTAFGASTCQERHESSSPSKLLRFPSLAAASAATQPPPAAEDLERFALGFEQRRSEGAQSVKPVAPLGAPEGCLVVEPVCRLVEHDRGAHHLLDHRPPREHLLERVA